MHCALMQPNLRFHMCVMLNGGPATGPTVQEHWLAPLEENNDFLEDFESACQRSA